ncbi:endonuclease/exonuclease/phosphatase family protein [Actinocatenispora sera]|uniref:endonuclease/exonuclease/phosphatase family protein n=1 Tax=Actinocatenispora sera TaxID=390989 RepID=UPI0033C8B4FF
MSGRVAVRRTAPRRRPVGLRDVPAVLAALLVTVLLAGHRLVPDGHGAGTALDSFLPWFGLLVVPVALLALATRSRLGALALLLPVVVWAGMFGPVLLPRGGGDGQLRAATQNLDAANPDPTSTVRRLVALHPDLVAVQELANDDAARLLDDTYPHQLRVGTVGLWSRYPMGDGAPVDLGLGWNRALRADVDTDHGQVRVYVAHLGSIRPGADGSRDRTLTRLADSVRADRSPRLLLLGDLNTATTDRALGQLSPPLTDAQRAAGSGFGFTWPARFPMTRPDQVLYRGLSATDASVADTGGSDHRAALADLRVAD